MDKSQSENDCIAANYGALDTCIRNLIRELRNAQQALSKYKTTIPNINSPDEKIYYMKTKTFLETINAEMHNLEKSVCDGQKELLERAVRQIRITESRKREEEGFCYNINA